MLREQVMTWSRGAGLCERSPDFAMRPFLRAFPPADAPSPAAPCADTVLWTIASFNVLSLQDSGVHNEGSCGLHGATGRPTLLSQSLEQMGILVAGIQEARTQNGTMRCGNFHRYASGADAKTCFGVELWIHDRSPCSPASVVVLHTSPTVLIASGSSHGQPLRFLVAHGPHRAHSPEVRASWWHNLSHLCHAHGHGALWIMMLDANCRVGSVSSEAVGDCQPDPEDDSGSAFHAMLCEMTAWLPSTFHHCMHGDGGTLRQRRNGQLDRSDFVAVPAAWAWGSSSGSAYVDPRISAGHGFVDHYATVVHVELCLSARTKRSRKATRIDVQAIADPNNTDAIAQIIRSSPRPPWALDSSEHAALLVDHLYQGLASAFPVPRRRMRAHYLSESSEALHRVVSSLRHAVRSRKLAIRLALLRCTWLAWRSSADSLHDLFCGKWLLQLEFRMGLSCMLLHRYGLLLRRSCRMDRTQMFADMAEEVAQADPSSMHIAVKKILRPKKFRKAGAAPLPKLFKADGTQCMSEQEIMDTWKDHFRVLEGGTDTDPQTLLQTCRHRHEAFEGTDDVLANDLPTWLDLEAAFRRTAAHKAAGPDCLPPMLCRRFGPQLTEVFWPLLLKTMCRASEPAGMKGGILHHIGKPNPKSRFTCDAQRGILVQSPLSKVFHRTLRGLIVRHWRKFALPLQIGGRSGCSASFGSLCSRAVLAVARQRGLSSALLFIDLSSAYYAVIRETLLGRDLSSRPVEEIAEALGLSHEDLHELRRLIEDEAILPQQDAPALLQEVARDFHQQTWFILAGDSRMVTTFRGTRPGGTLADILFSLLFGQALRRRRMQTLQEAVPTVTWNGERSPFHTASGPPAAETVDCTIPDVVYADDLCIPLMCAQARLLRNVATSVAADTFDALAPHALRVNFGPTKTAAIAVPVGVGARAARQELFCSLKGKVPVWAESRGMQWLDLVAKYRHLGSIVEHNGSMAAEVQHRLCLARVAFRDGKRRLFACKAVPIGKRAMLFRSHVLCTLLSGVGGWPLLGSREWRTFSSGVIGLYRQLLGLRAAGRWDFTTSNILALTGLPSPESLLQAERLRFLGQLVRHAPDELWALIGHFEQYQSALRAASAWLLAAVAGTCTLGAIDADWPSWASLLALPGKWRGLIKRAEAWHSEVATVYAVYDEVIRAAWQPLPRANADMDGLRHGCLACGVAFASFQKWSVHAQKVHGYRTAATRLAKGRTCLACGTQYANSARLRCHLASSTRCLQHLEAVPVAASSTTATRDQPGHVQAPAVRGWGRDHLPPAQPEICRPLLTDLRDLRNASDQDIYDVVASHIAPLPVLRGTLELWQASLAPGDLREAAADVLLVLSPDHLCSQVAGRHEEDDTLRCPDFQPMFCRPVLRFPPPAASIAIVGSRPSAWLLDWGLDSCAVLSPSLDTLSAAWSTGVRCFGVSVEFPPAPPGLVSLLAFRPMPLRQHRACCSWIRQLLRVFCCLFRTATLGRPARLQIPTQPSFFEPLTTWVQQSAAAPVAAESAHLSFPSCFTLEFSLL